MSGPAPVQTLMEWAGPTRRFFAAASSAIWEVTASGAVGPAVVTGTGNATFSHIMYANSGGAYLVAVNGADGVRTFNGTTWAVQTITGATATTFDQVASFKRRLWFANGTPIVYYLGTDAISGAATAFDLGPVLRTGGNIVRIFAASYDTYGGGLTEYISFLSDTGEMAVYTGTDPSSAATWALVGVFRVASPIGVRASCQLLGDALILTADGVVSILNMIRIDPSEAKNATLSQKINLLIQQDFQTYGGLSGWQILSFPAQHAIIVNVPTSATTFRQYVLNVLTGAWCRFTGWNAYCFGTFGDNLYFGGLGKVVKAWTGLDDEGRAINCSMSTAFNTFKTAGTNKRVTMVRPLVQASGLSGAAVGVNLDYEPLPVQAPYSVAVSGSRWDVAQWDVNVWAVDMGPQRDWASVGGTGRAISVNYAFATIGVDVQINGFDVMYEPAKGPAL